MDGKTRSDLRPGMQVFIVQKHHQPTGELTMGTVDVILTKKQNHTRGCKVRLISGEVGRVQQIVGQRQHVAADIPDELRGLWD